MNFHVFLSGFLGRFPHFSAYSHRLLSPYTPLSKYLPGIAAGILAGNPAVPPFFGQTLSGLLTGIPVGSIVNI